VSSELAEEKRRLRAEIGARRRKIAPPDARAAGRSAAARLLDDSRLVLARVALYAALPDEMPSRPLFEALADRGIPRLLPRMRPEGGLAFCPVERWEDLVTGGFGVLEPRGPAQRLDPDDLVVVPGIAFDAAGRRLGRGGGHYDRSFPEVPRAAGPRLVGFAYETQLVDRVPCDSRDRAMDAIVTERRILWAAEGGG
jgi:5-formyltetrahydrofolate cyclo-ligase